MPTILLDKLVFRANGVTILDELSVEIPPHGITAIIGPNGAGKSVTLRLLDDLLTPSSGEIRIVSSRPIRRAFVFQRTAFIRASAAVNVGLALAPLQLPRALRRARIEAALDWAGLSDRAAIPATKLSGGEQQRLALARARAVDPDLLLLDEPTASLDPAATEWVEGMIADMAARGAKALLVSHNLAQVQRLADDVIVLSRGRVVEHGPTRATLLSPRTPEARAYLSGELPWTSFAAAS